MQKIIRSGFLATVLASFFWSLQSIFFKGIGTDYGLFYPFIVRGLILSLLFGLYVYKKKIYTRIKKADYKWYISMPTILFTSLSCLFISLNNLNVGTVLFLHYCGVLCSGYFFGHLFFKERINVVKWASLSLSLVGLFIIFSVPSLSGNRGYLFLAFISGIGSSFWYICSKKLTKHYSYYQILTVDAIGILLLASIASLILREPLYLPSMSYHWLSIIGMTLSTLGGSLLVLYGFKRLEAQLASLILLLEVPFGLLLAYFLFKEVLTLQTLFGGTLILVGVAMPNLLKKSR